MLVLLLLRCYTFLELPCLKYWLSTLSKQASPGLPLVTNSQHHPTHVKTHKSVTHHPREPAPVFAVAPLSTPILRSEPQQPLTRIFPWCNATSPTFPGPQFPKKPSRHCAQPATSLGSQRGLSSGQRERREPGREKAPVIPKPGGQGPTFRTPGPWPRVRSF